MTFRAYTLALSTFAVLALAVQAETIKLKADLNGTHESPAKQVDGTGSLVADYYTDTHKLHYHVTYDGLTGPATAAHFHGPAAEGSNANPQVPIKAPLTSPIDADQTLTENSLPICLRVSGTSTCTRRLTPVEKSADRL